MVSANYPTKFFFFDQGHTSLENGEVITEMPLTLSVNAEPWLTFMCTPIHLEALATGFLFNEGIIKSIDEITELRLCDNAEHIDIWLSHTVSKPEKWRRTSGCTGGVTSLETDQEIENQNPKLPPASCKLSPEQVTGLIGDLMGAQDLYQRSGGVHTSALSNGLQIQVSAEDIGRHNTLDKIAGRILLEKIQNPGHVLLTTGRISSEMLQKAYRMGACLVISRTSPSSISVKLAEKWAITLIGYARRNSFRVYTHPYRVLGDDYQGI